MDRRELLLDVGIVAAASPLIAGTASARAATAPLNVLIAYHSATGNNEKMARGVADGARSVDGTNVVLRRVGDVTAEDLMSADAVIVGSPVYFGNMAGEVKTFFDNWLLKFDFYRDFRMRNKLGAAFATGGSISNGKEITMMAILEAMLINKMIVVSAGGRTASVLARRPDRIRPASTKRSWRRLATSASVSQKLPVPTGAV